MAHEILERDNLFTVRQPAWHGLGTVLTDYPTRVEAQALAHPWEPTQEPLYRKMIEVTDEGMPVEKYEEVDEARLNVRSDTLDSIGVVSGTYTVVTNTEMWDIAEVLEGQSGGEVRYETGGSLKGGRKVWLLLRLNEPLTVPGDPHSETIPYYALQNAHDGSGSFRGQATMTRIVCDNTSQIADLDARARGTEFMFQHTTNVKARIEAAREALAGWRESITQWQQFTLAMSGRRVDDRDVRDFLFAFIPEPPANLVTDRVRANIEKARQDWMGIFNGPTCAEAQSSALGLIHASVEYGQHYRKSNGPESVFKRAYLDRSELTASAVKLVNQLVPA